ncbi:PD-(D/E)XK nuclease family protein [Roseiflexus sp.]
MPLEREHVKAIILQELPAILEQDADVRQLILRLAQQHFANRGETESRFDRVLEELRRDREEQRRTWDENQRALKAAQDEARRTWDENQRALKAMQDEANRRWDENQRALKAMQDEANRRWEEQNRKWDENQRALKAMQDEANRKWDEDHQEIMAMIRRMEALDRKYDSTIGALGARWGLYSEQSFRNALRGILTGFFNLEVINVIEYDDTGAVFGRPDQIELDLIIKNGLLIICEIKSSVSKADVYAFERKARWYEQRHARQADRLMIISPMVDARAREAARRLQIDMYSFAEEAGEALSGEAERSDRATNADC